MNLANFADQLQSQACVITRLRCTYRFWQCTRCGMLKVKAQKSNVDHSHIVLALVQALRSCFNSPHKG